MTSPEYTPVPARTLSRGKKAGLVGGGVFAGLLVIGIAGAGGDETPAAAPVAAVTTTTATGSPDQAAIGRLQACIDMVKGTRPYDPAQWDSDLCGEYNGNLSSPNEATTAPAPESTPEVADEPTVAPTKELTVSQENAVETASDYLASSAFSRTG